MSSMGCHIGSFNVVQWCSTTSELQATRITQRISVFLQAYLVGVDEVGHVLYKGFILHLRVGEQKDHLQASLSTTETQ